MAFESLPTASRFRRDITRWTSGVKHGTSKVVRCPAGSAVTTPAFGALAADHVIHAVAPDSEFGYEGMYTGGIIDQEISGAVAGNDTPLGFAGGAADGVASQQFTPPDDLLLATYESALAQADVHVRVRSVAMCALGTGVKGWKPAISAALGLEACARLVEGRTRDSIHSNKTGRPAPSGAPAHGDAPADSHTGASLERVEFVVGGVGQLANECWDKFVRAHRVLLGAPEGLDDDDEYAAAAKRGELRWELCQGCLGGGGVMPLEGSDGRGLGGGTLLALERLDEFQEMWQWRRLGKNGRDVPLTPEQELAAVSRRSKR